MTGIPALLLLLTLVAAASTAIEPSMGSVALLFTALTFGAWFVQKRNSVRHVRRGIPPRRHRAQ